MVSELLYADKSLAEIAGYTTVQLMSVLCRKRDQFGKLVRDDGTPAFVRDNLDSNGQWKITGANESFSGMWKRHRREHGRESGKWLEWLQRESPATFQRLQNDRADQQPMSLNGAGSSWPGN